MEQSRFFLERLLKTPDLEKIVPHLQPEIVHRVIQHCGLEDCAELVALTTPEQLARILDVDVWRGRTPGVDEELDADRFGLWLEVLMQSGAAVAAEKLVGLDIEFVIAGLARHTAVFDRAVVASFTTLDGQQAGGQVSSRERVVDIGGYVVEARLTSAWDALVDLLIFLEGEHSEYLHRLMRASVRLSNGPREADGFHHLLEDDAQDMFDLACDREARREKQGFVTPAQARAFLHAACELPLDADRPPEHPIARAYFRGIDSTPFADAEAPDEAVAVVELLRDAGVLPSQPRALLTAGDRLPGRLELMHAYVESHAGSVEELAYLANTLMAGCSVQTRTFTPKEASDAAVAICNLGLENWPSPWHERDLVTAFQIGWRVLHRDVCLFTAERLIDVLAHVRCADRDIHLSLNGLRRELIRCLRDGAPWRARNALDVMLMLDAPSWAALLGLIDECPVMHASMGASQRACRAINPADFEFISQNSQISTVREFLESLPSTLAQ